MQMTNSEIIRRYKAADDRRKMIRILAELNACPKENIRQILREAGLDVPATGNRYTKKKGAEETEADGSKRKQTKLTEKAKRLLKNDEPTDSSDLSTRENVGTHQQDVGTMSEKKAAPTACQPAEPVDVWEENPRDITLGDLIGLIDRDRENSRTISIMDENGAEQLRALTRSPFLEDLEDYEVTDLDVGDKGWICVWLGEKKQRRAKA